jgi:hypothetical protein
MKDYILSKLSEYKAIFTERPRLIPSDAVVDAPITGNGDIGIALNSLDTTTGRGHPGSTGGGIVKPMPVDGALEVHFTKNDFWKASYGMDKSGGMKSIGKLLLIFDHFGGCDYHAEQIILNGTLTVKLFKEKRSILITAYTPRNENVIVVKVKNEKEPVNLRVELKVSKAADAEYSETYTGGVYFITKSFSGPGLAFPTAVAAMTKIMGKPDAEAPGAFALAAEDEAVIVTSVVTNHDDPHYREKTKEILDRVSPYWLADIFAKHTAWWRNFWIGSGLRLPSEPLIEKMWYASHYIMACCCGNKQFPPGLFANWVTTDTPNWSGDYHLNYNYQAPWWGLYSSNKIELTEAYDAPLMDYLPAAREAAQRKLGCRGIYSLTGLGPKGFAISRTFDKNGNDDISYWGQKSNASFAAVNMLMRFYSTYDLDYAREIAYPYLKETGAFWEDYLVFKDGRYWSFNDCIHENHFLANEVLEWNGGTIDYSGDCNPIVSLGLIRMVFKGLLDMSRELEDGDPRAEKWKHILEHISPFPLQQRGGKTVFRYTETGEDWMKTNAVGIQHIFPAGAIGLGSDNELLGIALNTLTELNRWEDYNAFPTFYAAAARLGYDPKVILTRLNEELRKHTYDNMYIYYGGGGIECCSGVPACVNEMLLQSHEGILRFFPAWDKTKDASFYNLRAYGAFLVSGKIENGTIGDLWVYSEKGRKCVFQSPFGRCAILKAGNGTPVAVDPAPEVENGAYSFDTEAGKCYAIRIS